MCLDDFKKEMKSYGYKVKIKKIKFSLNGEESRTLGVYDGEKLINTQIMTVETYEKYKYVLPKIYRFMRKYWYYSPDFQD